MEVWTVDRVLKVGREWKVDDVGQGRGRVEKTYQEID